MGELLELFGGISEEKSLHRYEPDKWSIRELLNHINDTERVFTFRALWFGRGFDSALPSFNQEIAAKGAEANQFSLASHLDDFRGIRKATLSLFGSLPADAWGRTGVASDNAVSTRALAYITAGHVDHHMAVLKERYL